MDFVPSIPLADRLPARIECDDDVRRFLAVLIDEWGAGFHPDTRAHEYVGDCPLAARIDLLMDQAFARWGDRVYEVGIEMFEERGFMPRSPAQGPTLTVGQRIESLRQQLIGRGTDACDACGATDTRLRRVDGTDVYYCQDNDQCAVRAALETHK